MPKIWPAYIGTIEKLDDSQERIKHIMEKEIPAVVPDLNLDQLQLKQLMDNLMLKE